jgi:hypothetical protein
VNALNDPPRSHPHAFVAAHPAVGRPNGGPPARAFADPVALLVVGLLLGAFGALLPHLISAVWSAGAQWTRIAVFACALIALYIQLMAISVGVTGKVSGAFWSSRNTYSLSRLQVLLWTWLVLSALLAVVICRAWGMLDTQHQVDGLSVALEIYIPPELLAVMSISLASGAAAPAILSLKSRADAPPPQALVAAATRTGAEVHAVGKLLVRAEQCPPLFKDLFQSDDAAAAGTVDIGKVQQFAVSLILWGVYLAMLCELFYSGADSALPEGVTKGATALPPLSPTFVYLLGLSHVGYLAYKAVPAPPAAGGSASAASADGRVGEAVAATRSVAVPPSTVLGRPLPPLAP